MRLTGEFFRFLIKLVILSGVFFSCSKSTSGPSAADAFNDLDIYERNARIYRAINLGNALEAPNEGDWGITVQEDYFQIIKDAGFTSVRIPVRFSAHAGTESPFTLNQLFMMRIDQVIEQALDRDLIVILDFHHYEEIMQYPQEHKQRFLKIWEQLAVRYKEKPGELIFEILNEPNNQLTSDLWNEYLEEAIQQIRETNPERTLVVGSFLWNSITGLSSLRLPQDDFLIVTFHYYNPFEFTHQGADWVPGSNDWLGTTWEGTDAQQSAVESDLNEAVTWSVLNGRPLFLGEFGAYNPADMASRANWTAFVARACEEREISWAYWEFAAGFGAFDPENYQWRLPLIEALIPPQISQNQFSFQNR